MTNLVSLIKFLGKIWLIALAIAFIAGIYFYDKPLPF